MSTFLQLNQEFLVSNHPVLQAMKETYREDEAQYIQKLLARASLMPKMVESCQDYAMGLVKQLRDQRLNEGGMDALLVEYDLSSDEGIALMCLAEALLRIPDTKTIDALIRDKLTQGDWGAHYGKSHSLFVNAATWGLMLTGKVMSGRYPKEHSLASGLKKLVSIGGEPIVRQAVYQAIRILSRQFVMGRTIEEALKRAKTEEEKGYRYSYDMLGEAAYTQADAQKYFEAYAKAIEEISVASAGRGPIDGPGISVKLSALHPRFVMLKRKRVLSELVPKVKELAMAAKRHNIGFTIDAEEADTLFVLLEVVEAMIADPDLKGWDGFGLAVQAYQKRANSIIKWLAEISEKHQKKIMVRLVKGAYWDTEIKLSQVNGLSGYPVFTRKITTDVNYIACVKTLLAHTNVIYPQFATHNAFTVAVVKALAAQAHCTEYEFQCLHGMGAPLYDQIVSKKMPCRIYAPVGTHEDLLAYLVRRLLENGANTSFVNRIADENLPISDMVVNPIELLEKTEPKAHPQIPLPRNLYGEKRLNSLGMDLKNPNELEPVLKQLDSLQAKNKIYHAEPTINGSTQSVKNQAIETVYSPINKEMKLGAVALADKETVAHSIEQAHRFFKAKKMPMPQERSQILLKFADKLEANYTELLYLLTLEAGKIAEDAIAEIREAVDFCRFYAGECIHKLSVPTILKGATGEYNQLILEGRGVILCISPWNFPLAIFVGQMTAAFAAGNCVIAKPAGQTSLIAAKAVSLFHEAGAPKEGVQLLPASGSLIGDYLVSDPRLAGIVFTGSTQTACHINQKLAMRPGAIVPFVAETGGQNAMIVDSSALAEQVVTDVITSSFKSAGQRCSSLRVLYLQEEIADKVIHMLTGAMQELSVGNPMALSTDVGPVIDENAKQKLEDHKQWLDANAKKISEVPMDLAQVEKGIYFAPCVYEIESINQLKEEHFGPILHIIRYKRNDLGQILDEINETGFGLTLGIHSRIDETVNYICETANVGNIYVNRNMIGAVVGVQPFGGEGLSGTGPKAGGPHYVTRLTTERTLSVNTTAAGGNASLMSLSEQG